MIPCKMGGATRDARGAQTQLPGEQKVQKLLHSVRGVITENSVEIGMIVRAMDPAAQPVLLLLPALILTEVAPGFRTGR